MGPGEVAGTARRAPETAEPFSRLLADLEAIVVPGVTQVQHPRYFGWFPSNATLSSALGDLAAAGLGALGITWQSAPALTEVEEVVVEWLRELTGLPGSWQGVIQDTASTACLVALLAARERATDYSEARGGLQAESAPLTVYTTEHAHSSIVKAVALAGEGGQPQAGRRRPGHLRHAPRDARGGSSGRLARPRPAAVVVSVGTTGTTAVDPLAEIVPLARRYGMWVHVDAAMAGSALLLPEMRWLVDGVEGADSLTWNPHKWLGTVLDCSLLYVADPAHLIRVMSTNPSYLRSAVDGEVTQYKDWGIPLGRRFRALKLWFHLRLNSVEPSGPGSGVTWTTPAGSRNRSRRPPAGASSPRLTCRPSCSGTNQGPGWTPTVWTSTHSPGWIRSTPPARPWSPRRCWTACGRCGYRSGRRIPNGPTSSSSGACCSTRPQSPRPARRSCRLPLPLRVPTLAGAGCTGASNARRSGPGRTGRPAPRRRPRSPSPRGCLRARTRWPAAW